MTLHSLKLKINYREVWVFTLVILYHGPKTQCFSNGIAVDIHSYHWEISIINIVLH